MRGLSAAAFLCRKQDACLTPPWPNLRSISKAQHLILEDTTEHFVSQLLGWKNSCIVH